MHRTATRPHRYVFGLASWHGVTNLTLTANYLCKFYNLYYRPTKLCARGSLRFTSRSTSLLIPLIERLTGKPLVQLCKQFRLRSVIRLLSLSNELTSLVFTSCGDDCIPLIALMAVQFLQLVLHIQR